MKKLIKYYTSFTRTERIGLICLCGLLIILITIRATLSLWVHPNIDNAKEQKLVAAWQQFKSDHPAANDEIETTQAKEYTNKEYTKAKDYQDAFDDNGTALPDVININTADSATLVRLKGIGPATASKIIAYRKNYGAFTSIDELLEIRHFPNATFELLKKHLSIK